MEATDLHIRLHLGYDENGRLLEIQMDDVIIIKEWFNSDSVLYSYHGLNTRLIKVEHELSEARSNFLNLGIRLDDMDKNILAALGEGTYTIDYTYFDKDIVRERAVGDYEYVKEYKYNEHGKPIEEVICCGLTKTIRQFEYDNNTGSVVRVVSTSVMI